jgi:hypothetical protein
LIPEKAVTLLAGGEFLNGKSTGTSRSFTAKKATFRNKTFPTIVFR